MKEGRWSTERGQAGRGLTMAVALLGTTALVGTLAVSPASAQSNEELLKRIEALEKQAPPQRGKRGMSLELSGQVNRALMFVADGASDGADPDRNIFITDTDASGTRFRLVAKGNATESLQMGAKIEVQFESNSNVAVSQTNEAAVFEGSGNNNSFTERVMWVWLKHASIGTLYLGQGQSASEGVAEKAVYAAGLMNNSLQAGGNAANALRFRDGTGNLRSTTVGSIASNIDGASRKDVVRYDTPSFAGAQLRVSMIQGDAFDVALHYARSLDIAGGIKMAAGAGWVFEKGDSLGGRNFSGSLSLMHEGSGFGVSGAGGFVYNRDNNDPIHNFWHVAVHYDTSALTDLGKTSFAVDWNANANRDTATDAAGNEVGNQSTSLGFGMVQQVSKIGADFYLQARQWAAQETQEDLDDLWIVMAGTRVKF